MKVIANLAFNDDVDAALIYAQYDHIPSIYRFSKSKPIDKILELLKKYNFKSVQEIHYDDGSSKSTSYRYYNESEKVFVLFTKKIIIDEDEDEQEDEFDDGLNLYIEYDSNKFKENYTASGVVVYYPDCRNIPSIINDITEMETYTPSTKNRLYMVVQTPQGGLNLKDFKIENKIKVDLDLNYNDDFKEIDTIIRNKLKDGSKGIIMLHGKPGTGKTSYIRWLLQDTTKKVIFIPPFLTSQLSSPSFITFMSTFCSDSLMIVEDAEDIVKSRDLGGNSAISTILNITDGLLSDVFNIQMLVTLNGNYNEVDEALRRKDRLIAEYEFQDLKQEKAQRLSDSLGFKNTIIEDMTLSEIYNQNDKSFKKEKKRIGFN